MSLKLGKLLIIAAVFFGPVACTGYSKNFDSKAELNRRYAEQGQIYENLNEPAPSGWFARQKYLPRSFRKAIFSGTPTGDDSYSQGFQNGCDTQVATMGEGFFRFKHPKFDTERLVNDDLYLRGFRDAMTYCTFRIDWEVH